MHLEGTCVSDVIAMLIVWEDGTAEGDVERVGFALVANDAFVETDDEIIIYRIWDMLMAVITLFEFDRVKWLMLFFNMMHEPNSLSNSFEMALDLVPSDNFAIIHYNLILLASTLIYHLFINWFQRAFINHHLWFFFDFIELFVHNFLLNFWWKHQRWWLLNFCLSVLDSFYMIHMYKCNNIQHFHAIFIKHYHIYVYEPETVVFLIVIKI